MSNALDLGDVEGLVVVGAIVLVGVAGYFAVKKVGAGIQTIGDTVSAVTKKTVDTVKAAGSAVEDTRQAIGSKIADVVEEVFPLPGDKPTLASSVKDAAIATAELPVTVVKAAATAGADVREYVGSKLADVAEFFFPLAADKAPAPTKRYSSGASGSF